MQQTDKTQAATSSSRECTSQLWVFQIEFFSSIFLDTKLKTELSPNSLNSKVLNLTKEKKKGRDLVFGIGVVLVNRSKEMVALEQRSNIRALAGGESHGHSVKRIELLTNCFVKQQENQNRRLRLQALRTSIRRRCRRRRRRRRRGRRRTDLVDGIGKDRHSTSDPMLQARHRLCHLYVYLSLNLRENFLSFLGKIL